MITKVEPYTPFQREKNEEKERLKKLKEIEKYVRKYNIEVSEVQFC